MSTPTNRRGRPQIKDPLLVTTFRCTLVQQLFFTDYIGGEGERAYIDSRIDQEGPEMREYLEQRAQHIRQMQEEERLRKKHAGRLHRQE